MTCAVQIYVVGIVRVVNCKVCVYYKNSFVNVIYNILNMSALYQLLTVNHIITDIDDVVA